MNSDNTPFNSIIASHTGLEAIEEKLSLGHFDSFNFCDVNNASTIALRLQMLLSAGRITEAVDCVKNKPPTPEWCEKAVYAFVLNGDDNDAKEIISWAHSQEDRFLDYSCVLSYVEASYSKLKKGSREPFVPLDESQKIKIVDLISLLKPVFDYVHTKGKIESQLEERCLAYELLLSSIIKTKLICPELVILLSTRTPVPLELAVATLNLSIAPDILLPGRLRLEHPESFEAHLLSAQLELEIFKNARSALDHGKLLWPKANSHDEKQRLFGLLLMSSSSLGQNALEEIAFTMEALPANSERLVRFYEASKKLISKKTDQAGAILEVIKNEDDPTWLQYKAHEMLQNGMTEDATDLLWRAALKLRNPGLLKQTSKLALYCDRFPLAIDAASQYLEFLPDDEEAHNILAYAFERRGEFLNASNQYHILVNLFPHNLKYKISYGRCLGLAGNTTQAIVVFDAMCGNSEAEPMVTLTKCDFFVEGRQSCRSILCAGETLEYS